MPELLVKIADQTFPLDKCVWITWAPCGCATGVLTAAYGDTAHATEEQALREVFPTKRERDQRTRQGYHVELISWDRYRAEIDLTARCPHPKADTKQAVIPGV